MSENKESGSGGWLKASIGAIAGLLSGAVMMYASPLVDKVLKPSRPIANFSFERDNLTVSFQDRSTGNSEGWWDFGDGTPLEPLTGSQQLVTHTYPGPGEYSAKLLVRNLLGEESERSVTVRLEGTRAAGPPAVDALTATALSTGAYAPATFRIAAQARNATLCVWDFGDGRPLELVSDPPETIDRMVTFEKPGTYQLRLAVWSGSTVKEASTSVTILDAPKGAVTAVLTVADQASRVESLPISYTFEDTFHPTSTEAVHTIDRVAQARPGFEISDVRVVGTAPGKEMRLTNGTLALGGPGPAIIVTGGTAQDLSLQLAPDRKSVRLTGKLLRGARGIARVATQPRLVVRVQLIQERHSPINRPSLPVATTVSVPGTTVLPLPAVPRNWVNPQRQMQLEIRDGNQIVWQDAKMPQRVPVVVKNRRVLVSAAVVGDQVRLDLQDAATARSGPQ